MNNVIPNTTVTVSHQKMDQKSAFNAIRTAMNIAEPIKHRRLKGCNFQSFFRRWLSPSNVRSRHIRALYVSDIGTARTSDGALQKGTVYLIVRVLGEVHAPCEPNVPFVEERWVIQTALPGNLHNAEITLRMIATHSETWEAIQTMIDALTSEILRTVGCEEHYRWPLLLVLN